MKRFLAVVLASIILLSVGASCVRESNLVVACYSIPTDSLNIGESIQFTNCSVSAEYYLWDFGDSTYSDLANPIHQFQEKKRYTVILRAYRNLNMDSIYSEILVGATETPTGIE